MADPMSTSRELRSISIIQEVYNSKNSLDCFEQELERALEDKKEVIVIEPNRLGDETSRWIAIGNCLHRTAYLSGLASLGSAFWTEKPYICTPLSVLSVLCTGVYTLAWQLDPCVHYQVETNIGRLLLKYPELGNYQWGGGSTSPVVLVRGNNARRNALHSGVTILAAVVCIWRVCDALK